jgi:ribosomal protein S27E
MPDLESILADQFISCLVVIADSTACEESAYQWAASSPAITRFVHLDRIDGSITTQMHDVLLQARVGWRFLVIATEAHVGHIRGQLLRGGAIDAEVVVVVTEESDPRSVRRRDVFCAHCHHVSVTESAIDTVVRCSGCLAELTVYHHYSRLHGAYMGFDAGVEEE